MDRALLVPFELITVLKGVPRKKGRRPTIDGYSSISSGYDETGPVIRINREKHTVTPPGGKPLKGTTKADPIQSFTVTHLSDGKAKIQYNQELRFTIQAVRGLFKIAVEGVAYFEGLDAARGAELDPARAFVREGAHDFRAILLPDPSTHYESYFGPRVQSPDGRQVLGMTILGIGFMCDFEPDFRGGRRVLEEMKRQGIAGQVIPNWPKDLWRKNNPSGN